MASTKPKFTNKEAGYRTNFIGAAKKSDGLYETEEECRARVEHMFDISEVECWWDDERMGFTSEPLSETILPEDTSVDNIDPDDTIVKLDDEIEEVVVETPPPTDIPADDAVSETADDESDPVPSVDGSRSYDLSASKGVADLQKVMDSWPWDAGDDALLDKIQEETTEAIDGTSEQLQLEDGILTVVGTSSDSEMITVLICALKWLSGHGLSVTDSLKAAHLRHAEQYDRYHDEPEVVEPEPDVDGEDDED
jgi:hypothetical protein